MTKNELCKTICLIVIDFGLIYIRDQEAWACNFDAWKLASENGLS